MNTNVIVWDLETVPNLRGYVAAGSLAFGPADDAEEQDAPRDGEIGRV